MTHPRGDEIEDHVRQIVLLAWSRLLGVPDTALTTAAATGRRVEAPTEPGDPEVVLLRLGGVAVLCGPPPLLEAARPLDDEVLALESTLLDLARPWSPRSEGERVLFHLDEPPAVEPSSAVAVSHDPAHVRQVEGACPADDVLTAGLGALDASLALVPDDGDGHATGGSLSAAGHRVSAGMLADMRVLTRADLRGRGLGAYAAAVGVQQAYEDGLVPQACVPQSDDAAQRLALGLGFVPTGSVTRLRLTLGG